MMRKLIFAALGLVLSAGLALGVAQAAQLGAPSSTATLMGTQTADAVAITGGTIDGVTIGSVTPIAITATTITSQSLKAVAVTSGVDVVTITGSAAGTPGLVSVTATGTDTNIGLLVSGKGSGVVAIAGTTVANSGVQVPITTSSVNFVKINGAATTASPAITFTGTDTNVGGLISVKGTGALALGGTTAANASLLVNTVASQVNQVQIAGSVTTAAPTISAVGTDTNITLAIAPKGSGTVFTGESHYSTGVVPPVLSSCGGGSPTVTGSNVAGIVTMGTSATGCTITFATTGAAYAYTSAPYCVVQWIATPLASQSYSVTSTAITTVQSSTSSNKLVYFCMAQSGG